ncbi:MAG TPA: flagellar assembly protein FliW [Lacisediminihabitans sp.]|nr:flagellar assembly protein FliW [Lacisediminihabitans sp.]HXD62156.1 flagellar assembly protein FliW [Lacisediminihabitans sp.]
MSAALSFIAPPPGFEPMVDFTLDDIEGANGLYALRAVESTSTRLFVLDAGIFLPEYTPEISDEQAASLELEKGEDALVLVVANPGESGTTMNLMAPIVVNSLNGRCAQFILDGDEWPLRAQLTARSA